MATLQFQRKVFDGQCAGQKNQMFNEKRLYPLLTPTCVGLLQLH
jgi:hypothetical protein